MAAVIEELWAEPEEISPDPAAAGLVDQRAAACAPGYSLVGAARSITALTFCGGRRLWGVAHQNSLDQ